jgi:hypothetical protein
LQHFLNQPIAAGSDTILGSALVAHRAMDYDIVTERGARALNGTITTCRFLISQFLPTMFPYFRQSTVHCSVKITQIT